MREWTDWAALIAVTFIVLVIAGVIAVGVAWKWQDSQDKRTCRQRGGVVTEHDMGTEWHCVGATPEAK